MIFSFSLCAIPLQVALVIYFGLEWLSLLEDGKCVIANTEIHGVVSRSSKKIQEVIDIE